MPSRLRPPITYAVDDDEKGTSSMAKNKYHEHLREVPLFADLDKSEMEMLDRATTELDYKPGRVLMREGEIAHEMFVLVSGSAEVTRGGEHVADIGPGGIVGELAMLTHSHRHGTVTVTSDTTVLHIDGRAFGPLLHEAPQIAVKMLPIVAARAIDNSEH